MIFTELFSKSVNRTQATNAKLLTMNSIKINKSTERLEAFSDAVIAITMTLLVLDIKVPHVETNR